MMGKMKGDPPKRSPKNIKVVILSRFELLTSCLSSKRSKPTELKDQYRFAPKAMQSYIKFLNLRYEAV